MRYESLRPEAGDASVRGSAYQFALPGRAPLGSAEIGLWWAADLIAGLRSSTAPTARDH